MRSAATSIASLLLLVACGAEEPVEVRESDYTPSTYRPRARAAETVDPGVRLVDVTQEAGIDFVHVNGAEGRKWLPETMGSGVGMLDYDGDGDLDLLFVQSGTWREDDAQPTHRLYRNEGEWRFTDVTAQAGLDFACYGMGVTIADYDADGDPDLYLTALGRDRLLRNDGGRFVEVEGGPDGGRWTDTGGEGGPVEQEWAWSTGAAWYDADGDGDLDLVVVPYVRWTPERDVFSSYVAGEKAYTRPQLYEGDHPRLYLQDDDGGFTDATGSSGLASARVLGKSMAVCVDDFDGDGRSDLFVANDTVQNFLFLATGPARYEESAIEAAVAYDDSGRARAAMGIDSGDYRNDGSLSVAIGNFSEEPVSLFTALPRPDAPVLFEDDANRTRIGHPTLLPLTFGLVLTDADLDGWIDLLLANGHIEPSIPKLKQELRYAQAPQYFRNLAGERFVDVSADAGPGLAREIVGRGLAAGDLDGDGDLDYVFTSNGGAPLVLRNDTPDTARALRLRLRQPGTRNPDALGAVVHATVGGVTQRRAVRTGGSYLSQGELTVTFGLGGAERADAVVVRWPDGVEQRVEGERLAAGTHEVVRR